MKNRREKKIIKILIKLSINFFSPSRIEERESEKKTNKIIIAAITIQIHSFKMLRKKNQKLYKKNK